MKKIALLIGILFLFSACSNDSETDDVSSSSWDAGGEEEKPVAVEVLEVTKGQLIPYVEASGTIKGIREAWVLAGTQGEIESFSVSLGDQVKEGEVLLEVKNDLQRLNRDLARQQYEAARLDYESLENSFAKGGLSRSDLNNGKTRLLQAESAYRSAEDAYNNTFVKAPFDGTVALLESSLAVGATLAPGTRVALIIDRSSMKMELSLGERQINLIKKNQPALIQIGATGEREPVEGQVSALGMGSDNLTGSFPVIITWDQGIDESIRSGLTAGVSIPNTREEPRIMVPSSAIIIRNRRPSVIVAEEGKAVIKEVVPGEALGGHRVIEEGLSVGELLIVSALNSLGDGALIEPTLRGTTGEWK